MTQTMTNSYCDTPPILPNLHCKKEITICKANECDKYEIAQLMSEAFFKNEPTSIMCGVSDKLKISDELLEIVTDPVDDNLSFIAQYRMKDMSTALAGVVINAIRPPVNRGESGAECLQKIKCDREKELLQLWSQISKLPCDPCPHFGNIQEVVMVEYLSVHPCFQRQGLAKKMLHQSICEACKQGFCIVRMDCTSAYSASLAQSVGMRCIDEVYYKDLRNSKGKRFKNIEHPHIKAVVMITETSGS